MTKYFFWNSKGSQKSQWLIQGPTNWLVAEQKPRLFPNKASLLPLPPFCLIESDSYSLSKTGGKKKNPTILTLLPCFETPTLILILLAALSLLSEREKPFWPFRHHMCSWSPEHWFLLYLCDISAHPLPSAASLSQSYIIGIWYPSYAREFTACITIILAIKHFSVICLFS